MSVESVALALGGLVAGYKLDEASGTTLADFGPNTLPATLAAGGTLGGTAVIPGVARALSAAGGSTLGVGSRAVTGGTPLQLSAAVTAVIFVRSGGSPAATKGILQRTNNWALRVTTSNTLVGFVWAGGVSRQLTAPFALASTKRYMLAVAFDGVTAELSINAHIVARDHHPGTITATTDALEILSNGAQNFLGDGNYAMVFNRRLGLGELRQLLREGDATLDRTEGIVFFDHISDSLGTIVSGASSSLVCGECPGRMRSTEARVISSASRAYHPGCRAGRRRALTAITSSSTQAQIVDSTVDLAYELIDRYPRRAETEETSYHDGVKMTGPALGGVEAFGNVTGLGTLAATVARYTGASVRDPCVAYARQDLAYLQSKIDAAGFMSAADFGLAQMSQIILMLRGIIPTSEYTAALADLSRANDFFYNGGVDSTSITRGAASAWYVNGNRETGSAIQYWIDAYLTGSSARTTRYNNHWARLVGPTGVLSPLSSFLPASNGGSVFGWKEEIIPVEQDGSDGKGWFRESGTNGFYQVNSPGTFLDGLDWGYLALANQFMTKHWLISQDANALRYSNMMFNKSMERVNTSTWVMDQTNGSRQNVTQLFLMAVSHVLAWKAGRSDITATDRANQYITGLLAGARSGAANPSEIALRAVAYDPAAIIMAALDWPGH